MKRTFATKVTDSVCKWVSPQCTIDCFADISTRETCTVTQKLDLDQMSERSIRHTEEHKYDNSFSVANFGFIASYDPVRMILLIFVT